jgi:hypothetical protein
MRVAAVADREPPLTGWPRRSALGWLQNFVVDPPTVFAHVYVQYTTNNCFCIIYRSIPEPANFQSHRYKSFDHRRGMAGAEPGQELLVVKPTDIVLLVLTILSAWIAIPKLLRLALPARSPPPAHAKRSS